MCPVMMILRKRSALFRHFPPYKYRVDVREDLFIKLYLVNKNTMKAALCSYEAGVEAAFAEFELAPVTEEYDVLNAVWAE